MSQSIQQINLIKQIPESLDKSRLDLALSTLLPEYSREKIKQWIKDGYVTVDNKILRPKDSVHTNQIVNIRAFLNDDTELQPQSIPIEVVYQDPDIIVVNKLAGLVTHPGAGNPKNTLLNALLYHYPELVKLPRAGIIHRLDKDTSGVMVVTRNLVSHNRLTIALQQREIKREYETVVHGSMIAGATIEAPIGRHLTKRTLMAVRDNGKSAVTHYRIIKRFREHTYLRVSLETGRTHQIRVHLAHIGHPIVGDLIYGKNNRVLKNGTITFNRQALHAKRLELVHPTTRKLMSWETELTSDIKNLLKTLANL